jgi:hypothetical protein
MVTILLKTGIDEDRMFDGGVTNNLLFMAIEENHMDCARLLVDAGADINREYFGISLKPGSFRLFSFFFLLADRHRMVSKTHQIPY